MQTIADIAAAIAATEAMKKFIQNRFLFSRDSLSEASDCFFSSNKISACISVEFCKFAESRFLRSSSILASCV